MKKMSHQIFFPARVCLYMFRQPYKNGKTRTKMPKERPSYFTPKLSKVVMVAHKTKLQSSIKGSAIRREESREETSTKLLLKAATFVGRVNRIKRFIL